MQGSAASLPRCLADDTQQRIVAMLDERDLGYFCGLPHPEPLYKIPLLG
jgi:hypothetical protein